MRPLILILFGLAMSGASVVLLTLPLTTPLLVVAGLMGGVGGGLVMTPILVELSRRSADADRGSAFSLFSAACVMAAVPNNLPVQVTRFIGRVREVAELKRLLTESASESRLITLTGAGGCGKTRLALRVAEDSLSSLSGWRLACGPFPVARPGTCASIDRQRPWPTGASGQVVRRRPRRLPPVTVDASRTGQL